MSVRWAWIGLGVSLALADHVVGQAAEPGVPTLAEARADWAEAEPLFAAHCARCHGARRPKANVVLAARDADQVRADPELWSRALRQVEFGAMPPASRKVQPSAEERTSMVAALRGLLTAVESGAPADPGRPVLRRLSRSAYQRTVRDLLGVSFDAAARLPADAQAYGFDSVGDTLFVPPMLLERYADAAATIAVAARETAAGRALLGIEGPEMPTDQLVRRMLRRGFRRPPTDDEVASRLALVAAAEAQGLAPHDGIETALQSVLMSPHFLFRVEEDREVDRPWRIGDHELAVRLSYFLWSSMPDAELDGLADRGVLCEPDVLRGQVARMLADPRARALAEDFAAQWLGFGRVRDIAVDFRRFPAFRRLRGAMVEEAERTFHRLVVENRPVRELLDADEVIVDRRLAAHYGLEMSGSGWQVLALDPERDNRARGGVLGMAAVLTATSDPLRTNPVRRGAWVLRALLATDPPPPPANAGTLPEDDRQPDKLSLRQRLERHRQDVSCASCHAHLDPLGLALENFDGIGAWRDDAQGRPVESATVLADGTWLGGPTGLKRWLVEQEPRFVRSVISHLFTYALGRPPRLADEAVLHEVERSAAEGGYRFGDLVLGIVASYPFQHRRRP